MKLVTIKDDFSIQKLNLMLKWMIHHWNNLPLRFESWLRSKEWQWYNAYTGKIAKWNSGETHFAWNSHDITHENFTWIHIPVKFTLKNHMWNSNENNISHDLIVNISMWIVFMWISLLLHLSVKFTCEFHMQKLYLCPSWLEPDCTDTFLIWTIALRNRRQFY